MATLMARIVLIGGTSHTGKSTLAHAFATELGTQAISTDKLGRHPGRPWPRPGWQVPPHVAEYYGTLTLDEMMDSVLAHYRGMAPIIAELIAERVARGEDLVLEGSGVLPATVLDHGQGAKALWLVADDAVLRARILAESNYANAPTDGRHLIESFIVRAQAFDRMMREEAQHFGFHTLDSGAMDRATLVAEAKQLLF
jgi:2-phosphoglycerate kinase